MTQNKDNDKEHENMTKGLFRLGARAWCSGTGTILSSSLNAVPKANTIKTVPNTAATSIGRLGIVRFGHCVQTSAQNSACAWAPGTGT